MNPNPQNLSAQQQADGRRRGTQVDISNEVSQIQALNISMSALMKELLLIGY